jgi:hypothetical protein
MTKPNDDEEKADEVPPPAEPIRVRNVDTSHRTWPTIVNCAGNVLSLDPGEEDIVFELPSRVDRHLRIVKHK